MDGQKLSSRPVLNTSQGTDKIHVVRNGVSYQQEARFFNPPILQNDVVGGVVFLGGMTYYVWASQYTVNSVVYNSFVSGTVTLDDGGANDRFDRFVVEVNTIANPTTASIVVVKGTEGVNPVLPSIDVEKQVQVSFALVAAGQTENTNITSELVYDENTGEPSEWDNKAIPLGGNLDYTIDPFSGTKSYRQNQLSTGTLSFLNDALVDFGENNYLSFAYKGTLTETSSINIKLNNRSSGDYFFVSVNRSNIVDLGYNGLAAGWNVIQIPFASFVANAEFITQVDELEFKFVNTPVIELDKITIIEQINGSIAPIAGGLIISNQNYILQPDIDTVISYTTNANQLITLPAPNLALNRVVRIVNRSNFSIAITPSFRVGVGAFVGTVTSGTTCLLQSNGTYWYKIN